MSFLEHIQVQAQTRVTFVGSDEPADPVVVVVANAPATSATLAPTVAAAAATARLSAASSGWDWAASCWPAVPAGRRPATGCSR